MEDLPVAGQRGSASYAVARLAARFVEKQAIVTRAWPQYFGLAATEPQDDAQH